MNPETETWWESNAHSWCWAFGVARSQLAEITGACRPLPAASATKLRPWNSQQKIANSPSRALFATACNLIWIHNQCRPYASWQSPRWESACSEAGRQRMR